MIRCALLLAVVAALPVVAAADAPVAVVIGCDDADELRRLLELELPAIDPDRRLAIECTADSVRVQLVPANGAPLTRELVLDVVPTDARARTIAVAAAELVFASRSAPTATVPPPIRQPPTYRSPPDPPPPPPPRPSAMRLALVAGTTRHRAHVDPMLGGAVRLRAGWARHWELAVDLGLDRGSTEMQTGAVDTGVLSIAGTIRIATGARLVRAGVGVGATLGVARLDGTAREEPYAGRTLHGAVGGPTASTFVELFPERVVSLELGATGGWNALSVVGSVAGDEAVALDGAWVTLQLALGMRL